MHVIAKALGGRRTKSCLVTVVNVGGGGGGEYQVLYGHCTCRKIVQGKVGVVEKVKSRGVKRVTGNMRQKGKVTEMVGEMMERVDKVKVLEVVADWCTVF